MHSCNVNANIKNHDFGIAIARQQYHRKFKDNRIHICTNYTSIKLRKIYCMSMNVSFTDRLICYVKPGVAHLQTDSPFQGTHIPLPNIDPIASFQSYRKHDYQARAFKPQPWLTQQVWNWVCPAVPLTSEYNKKCYWHHISGLRQKEHKQFPPFFFSFLSQIGPHDNEAHSLRLS